MDFKKAYRVLGEEMVPYYRKYTHDLPLIMSHETYQSSKQLGAVLHKAIRYLVAHYMDFLHLMPLTQRDLRVLEIAAKYPFRTGTFRTDFVFDENKSLKIIEMTTRQPLNAYAVSGFSNEIGQQMAEHLQLKGVVNDYPRLLDFMQKDFLKTGKVTVVKGNERLGDFKTYSKWFEIAEMDYQVIDLKDLSQKLDLLKDATVIEELNHAEISALPDALIDELCAAGVFNDFRNLFLIHDKRFFRLLSEPFFLERALSVQDRKLLAFFMVPTYTFPDCCAQFDAARANPGDWILKTTRFGKSEGIYAGCVTSPAVWEELFRSQKIEHMVLQPMIRQYRFKGTIGEEVRNDYVAGTFLYFDHEFFGPGIYRASSYAVTNVKDDRKVAQVVAQREERYDHLTI